MQRRHKDVVAIRGIIAWQGSQTKAEKEVRIMAEAFGSLPFETAEKLSLSKSSRSRSGSARNSSVKTESPASTVKTGTTPKIAKTGALGIRKRKTTKKPDESKPVRRKLIDRVRAEIAAGTFETPDRIEATIDCILDEILER